MKKLLIILITIIILILAGITASSEYNKNKIKSLEQTTAQNTQTPISEDQPPETQDSGNSLVAPDESNYMAKSGDFNRIDNIHYAEGQAQIVSRNGDLTLELKNFKSATGPDLYIYITTQDSLVDLDFNSEKQAINLGKLKSTTGDQTYEIPSGYNINDLKKAVIWCKAFNVVFSFADLYTVSY